MGVGNSTVGPFGSWIQSSFDNSASSFGNEPLLLNPLGGSVGIGTSSPSATALLTVNGSCINQTGSWGTISDARIKTVTGDFTDGLNVINKIHTIRYKFNANAPFQSDDEQIGIIAQEMEKVAPYMVSQHEYKQIKDLRQVNNQAYVFLLINAVKEQQAEIEILRSENTSVKSDVEKLKASVETLQEILGSKAEK